MLSFIEYFGIQTKAQKNIMAADPFENPGRGWYHIYTQCLGSQKPVVPRKIPGETLALLRVDISAYRDRDLDESACNELRDLFERFVQADLDLIIRICYDTEGKGMVKEPSLFSQVKNHMIAAARIAAAFHEHIFVWQGLLVGNWGEMHGSRYLSSDCMEILTNLFQKETGGKIRLAFRKPVHLRQIANENETIQNIGFFNDGILGTPTHMGTFAPESESRVNWTDMWPTADEIRFMKPYTEVVPYGGEALMAPAPVNPRETIEILRGLGVSYLNSAHEASLLEYWQNVNVDGCSLYDHIGNHMGYRLRTGKVSRASRESLTLEIINEGFGGFYEDVEMKIFASYNTRTYAGQVGEVQGQIRGAASLYPVIMESSFFRSLPKGVPVTLALRMNRKSDQRVIRFAQQGNDEYYPFATIQKWL